MEEYCFRGGERLRRGYTTGSCAAGAAGAAAAALLSGTAASSVRIVTPKGIPLKLPVSDWTLSPDRAVCAVVKESGDDPDITNGIKIFAEVSLTEGETEIFGGEGIGRVTKKGLDQPVGEAAINSVPRQMIRQAVSEAARHFGYGGGFRIVIFVPGGAELAKKTYNPRMGIEGGISIIGTTGIVEPMSSAALTDTIRLEERMRRAEGLKNLLLTPGNYGERFLQREMPHAFRKSVKCSNFIGEAIDAALEYGFRGVLIAGHIGKLVKLGAGIMNTHSAQADGRMDVLVTCGVLAGAEASLLRGLPECAATDAALEILDKGSMLKSTMEILSQRAQYYLDAKVKNAVRIGAVMFSEKYGVLVRTPAAEELIRRISEEYDD